MGKDSMTDVDIREKVKREANAKGERKEKSENA